ncbi:MAG: hypothetical protein HFJ09_15205 [Lachnospiraceae bacterium]|nr:hypothetical protein [Lachnospiraceae bacterium]
MVLGYWCISLAEEEIAISVSGTRYKTSNRIIEKNYIITIDLSLQSNNVWRDFARTIIIEDGKVVETINNIKNIKWKQGLCMEEMLRAEMRKFKNINTTFEELYFYINEIITLNGYII